MQRRGTLETWPSIPETYYRTYGPMVLRRCRQMLRDEERARDAMHDTFVRLLMNAQRLDHSAPSSLLFRIATNVCLNEIRAERRRPVRGGQIAGVVNIAEGRLRGAQIGVVNIGGDVRGLQLGLVNIASRVRGLQLGLVNVAERHDGLPVGLATVVRDGRRAPEVWSSDLAPISVGVKLGTHRVYTLAALRGNRDALMGGLGLGVHSRQRRYYIDIDLTAYGLLDYDLQETDNVLVTEARAMIGLPALGDVWFFAGASLTGIFAFDGKPGANLSPLESKVYRRSDYLLRLAPGLFAGLAY